VGESHCGSLGSDNGETGPEGQLPPWAFPKAFIKAFIEPFVGFYEAFIPRFFMCSF